MNADDLNKLPQYIEAPSGGLWGPLPENFSVGNEDAILVKLKDVKTLLSYTTSVCEKTVVVNGVEYASVGMGSAHLMAQAKRYAWELYSWGDSADNLTAGWRGNTPTWEYFIRKE